MNLRTLVISGVCFFTGLCLALAIATSTMGGQAPTPPESSTAPTVSPYLNLLQQPAQGHSGAIGRYQISNGGHDGFVFLIDTATGRVWYQQSTADGYVFMRVRKYKEPKAGAKEDSKKEPQAKTLDGRYVPDTETGKANPGALKYKFKGRPKPEEDFQKPDNVK